MRRFDLFGSISMGLVTVAEAVTTALGVTFEIHESSYLGGEYLRSVGKEGEEILVQANVEDEEGYLIEPEFPDYPVLVYVNRSGLQFQRALAAVPGLQLLRTELI